MCAWVWVCVFHMDTRLSWCKDQLGSVYWMRVSDLFYFEWKQIPPPPNIFLLYPSVKSIRKLWAQHTHTHTYTHILHPSLHLSLFPLCKSEVVIPVSVSVFVCVYVFVCESVCVSVCVCKVKKDRHTDIYTLTNTEEERERERAKFMSEEVWLLAKEAFNVHWTESWVETESNERTQTQKVSFSFSFNFSREPKKWNWVLCSPPFFVHMISETFKMKKEKGKMITR